MKCPSCGSYRTTQVEKSSIKYQCENCGLSFVVRDEKSQQRINELYKQYAPSFRVRLKRYFPDLPESDIDDQLQDAFVTMMEKIDTIDKEKEFTFKTALNKIYDWFRKGKGIIFLPLQKSSGKEYDEDDMDVVDPSTLPEEIDWKEREECLLICVEKARKRYQSEYPQALCPLLVTLSDNPRPIEEIAQIIDHTVPETKKLLKKCRKEMKHYQDYEEYRQKHGAKTLCLLLFELIASGWSRERIEKTLSMTPDNRRKSVARCRQLMQKYINECRQKHFD